MRALIVVEAEVPTDARACPRDVVVGVQVVALDLDAPRPASAAVAAAVELEDDGVVEKAVDGRGGGHGVFEDPLPFAEHEVAGDEQRAALVALGEEDVLKAHEQVSVGYIDLPA